MSWTGRVLCKVLGRHEGTEMRAQNERIKLEDYTKEFRVCTRVKGRGLVKAMQQTLLVLPVWLLYRERTGKEQN